MAEITKYSVYLNEHQQHKLDLLAATTGKDPEEIINNAVYSYLLIVDPLAEDTDPPQDQTEILFTISDTEAGRLYDLIQEQGQGDLTADDYTKLLLLQDLHPEQDTATILEAIRQERERF